MSVKHDAFEDAVKAASERLRMSYLPKGTTIERKVYDCIWEMNRSATKNEICREVCFHKRLTWSQARHAIQRLLEKRLLDYDDTVSAAYQSQVILGKQADERNPQ